jgi:diacylglycerol kinase (ATP)
MPPILLIVNGRASGVRRDPHLARRATEALRTAGADPELVVTDTPAELDAALGAAGGRRVVVTGGDGSIHAVANAGGGTAEIALLPAGRANNVARALGIPRALAEAAAVAVRGRPRAIDALRVVTPERRLYAVEGVSAGFQAAARERYRAPDSSDLTAGVRALVFTLARLPAFEARVRLDDRRLADGWLTQLFVTNLPLFGFGFRVDPLADPSDGRLGALALRAGSRTQAVRLLNATRRGAHLGRPGVTRGDGRTVEIAEPVPLVADAEPLGTTTATVAVVPGHLRVVIP